MAWLDYFKTRRTSAAVAKDRLQIIVARERSSGTSRDYLPLLHQELVQVLAKYEDIDPEQVTVSLDRHGDCDVLELNIVLPEGQKRGTEKAKPARTIVISTTPSA